MALEIELPFEMEGKLIKELVLTALLGSGKYRLGLEIINNKVKIKNVEYFKDVLSYSFSLHKYNNEIQKIINNHKGNYKGVAEEYIKYFDPNVTEKNKIRNTIDNIIKNIMSKDNTTKTQLNIKLFPIFTAELLEYERKFGGQGSRKADLEVNILVFALGMLALARYQLVNFEIVKNKKRKEKDKYYVIALIDTTLQSELCKPSINWSMLKKIKPIIRNQQLSRLGLIFLSSMVLDKSSCQQLVVVKELISQGAVRRADIVEKMSYSSMKPLMHFWNLIDQITKVKILKLFDQNKGVDTFNRFSNYIFEGISGVLSPSEVIYFIAKDTFLKDKNIKEINSYVLKNIRNALEVLTHEKRYSA